MSDHSKEVQIQRQFIAEVLANLKRIEKALDALRRPSAGSEIVDETFRAFHGIKGISGYVDAQEIGNLSHAAETLLRNARESKAGIPAEQIDLLLQCHDMIFALVQEPSGASAGTGGRDLLNRLRRTAGESSDPATDRVQAATGASGSFEDTARQQLTGLSVFFTKWRPGPLDPRLGAAIRRKLSIFKRGATSVGRHDLVELVVQQESLVTDHSEWSAADIESFGQAMNHVGKRIESPPDRPSPEGVIEPPAREEAQVPVSSLLLRQLGSQIAELTVLNNRLGHLIDRARDINLEVGEMFRGIKTELDQCTGSVMKSARRMQLVPLGVLFERVPRIVREIARTYEKRVDLTIQGDHTEVDHTISDQLADPLTHVIRNAIDHGLETLQERKDAGKPEVGSLFIHAYTMGKSVLIDIFDDGRGIDSAAIRAKALRLGLITAIRANAMKREELIDLIFNPGFSLSDEITMVSGRGVGMDAVRKRLEELEGRVEVNSEIGQGTTIRFIFPNIFTLVNCLIVRCGAFLLAVPTQYARETLRISEDQIEVVDGRRWLRRSGRLSPLYRLTEQLDIPEQETPGNQGPAIVVNAGNRETVFQVDELKQIMVAHIRPLPEHLVAADLYSGITTLGDGSLAYALNVLAIVDNPASSVAV